MTTLQEETIERKATPVKAFKMQFVLTGFTHSTGFRVFSFERIGEDRLRTKFTVRTDLALTRRYGLQLQELPLLCRSLLERNEESDELRSFTFNEEEMQAYAKERAAARDAASSKRKPVHRPTGENLGIAWRSPRP